MTALNRPSEAAFHFRRAIELAPESDCARDSRNSLHQLADSEAIQLVDFEVTRFDGSHLPLDFDDDDEESVKSNAVGVSHDLLLNKGNLKLLRTGIDWTHSDTRGSDFRSHGVSLFGETVLTLPYDVELSLQGGWGHRDYADYEFSPDRDEDVWRA